MRALEAVERWGAGSVAIGVIDASGRRWVRGPATEVRPLASVTKLLVAMAVLVAAEEDSIELEDAAGPPSSTIAHLMSHASGLGLDDASRVLAPAGARRIYSNAGIEVAATHLQQRTGIAFAEYLHEGVISPLGWTGFRLDGSPAHGGHASLEDLLRLCAELLEPRLVQAETLRRARTTAFPGLSGVVPGFGHQRPCDWGIGFEVAGRKQPHWIAPASSPETFGHFGRSGAFLWVDPVAQVACAALCEAPFGPWAKQAWPALGDAVLKELDRVSNRL